MTGQHTPANHSEQTLESLSALVDGEATPFEERRLLSMTDEGMVDKWRSYQMTSAVLRREVKPTMRDLSASISELVALEAGSEGGAYQDSVAPKPATKTTWRDWAAKSAIAASVAVAVIAGVQFSQTGSLNGQLPSEDTIAHQAELPVVAAPAGFDLPAPVARNVSLGGFSEPNPSDTGVSAQQFLSNAQVEAELQQLFLEHAELSAESGQFGLMPMARAAKTAPAR